MATILLFRVLDTHLALDVRSAERVLAAAWVSPLPGAPDCVKGIVRIGDDILPVFDLAKRLFSTDSPVTPSDFFILAQTSARTVLLHVHDLEGLVDVPDDAIEDGDTILPDLPHVKGVVRLENGVVLISALDNFLGIEEEKALDQAINDSFG